VKRNRLNIIRIILEKVRKVRKSINTTKKQLEKPSSFKKINYQDYIAKSEKSEKIYIHYKKKNN
jgi:hypothetical protein